MTAVVPYTVFLARQAERLTQTIKQDLHSFQQSMGSVGSSVDGIVSGLTVTINELSNSRRILDDVLHFHHRAQACYRADGTVDEGAYAALLMLRDDELNR